MPLVRVVGGVSREDAIQIYQLSPGPDGGIRQLRRGGPAMWVSAHELRKLASIAQVEVIEEDHPAGLDQTPKPAAQSVWQTVSVPAPSLEQSGEPGEEE